MSKHDEIVSLIQTLGTSFRVQPEKTDERLNVLTEVQKENLLNMLKRISEGGEREYAFGHKPPERVGEKPDTRAIWDNGPTPVGPRKTKPLPEPGTYYPINDRSALCSGCPTGCELKWDDKGNYSGFSCIVGQETAEILAEYYRAE